MKNKQKKILPFKNAVGLFILWTVLLVVVGYVVYELILVPYIINAPTIIKGGIQK